jgi:hypothetical protein
MPNYNRLEDISQGAQDVMGKPNYGIVRDRPPRENRSWSGGNIPPEGMEAGNRILDALMIPDEQKAGVWQEISGTYGPTWYTAGLRPEEEAFSLLVEDIRQRFGL